MLTDRWTTFRYHPTQQRLWQSSSRFKIVVAGRRSGKTELAKRNLVRWLPMAKPWYNPRYFYGAPTETQAVRIAWQDLLDLIPRDWISNINRSDHKIQTIFGSEIWVVGLDKPQRIEGVGWDGCVLDECSDLKPDVFNVSVLPALMERQGWCWRIGVPKITGIGVHEFRRVFRLASDGKLEDHEAFSWDASDILTEEQVQIAKEVLDTRFYTTQIKGEFVDISGKPYHAFTEKNVQPCSYNPNMPLVIGCDFNVSPMCWVFAHRYGKRLEVFDEVCLYDTNTQRTLEVIQNKFSNHSSTVEVYGDATGRARKTSASQTDYQLIASNRFLNGLGVEINVPNSNPLEQNRIAIVNSRLENADGVVNLIVDPKCEELIASLNETQYKPGTREVLKTYDTNDKTHAAEALGYVVHYLYRYAYDSLDVFSSESVGQDVVLTAS